MFYTVNSCFLHGELQLITGIVSFGSSEVVVERKENLGKDFKIFDEVFKLVEQNVDLKAKTMAMEPPKEIIKSELFVHQKEGLGWLFQRENSKDLPSFWEEKNGIFFNFVTNYTMDNRPEPLRGRLFADDMGLGKTLTLLSLIALDKCITFKNCSVGRGNQ
ncbi:hypothetical protein LWI29_003028 [Acer saccharum]|uniref:SNF2 N-terminal domain-containing protein n=1 Tax=Acer saccharum TaxID=4024 RepID=A0AA39SQN4_ACESA|nr:hypothetical protein LWI29_003028 [Acer saccharum]